MREVFLLPDDSTEDSLLLSVELADEEAERLVLSLTDEVKERISALLAAPSPATPERAEKETPEEVPEGDPTRALAAARKPAPAASGGSPDPGLSAPLTLRPRDIQERVRSGATAKNLAEEMGVAESRVEPYAHPVLQERARIAELAKGSHPVREDGPARLNLWDVLETAFAARNTDLHNSRWDAYRAPGGQWVVTVSWQTGKSQHIAEWTLQDHLSSNATAVARNESASQLIDPNYEPPVRRLSAVREGEQPEAELGSDLPLGVSAPDQQPTAPDKADGAGTQPASEAAGVTDLNAVPPAEEDDEQGFLQHPDGEHDPGAKPHKRRRKAVTPAWEDVLMSVRTNTKRPRK